MLTKTGPEKVPKSNNKLMAHYSGYLFEMPDYNSDQQENPMYPPQTIYGREILSLYARFARR